MRAAWANSSPPPPANKRAHERRHIMLPARLTWKDSRGSTRFASVVTRDISECGVFVELQTPASISVFRLAQFQLEREARDTEALPATLKQGRILAAVYRVHAPTRAGGRQGVALRLMVDPRRQPDSEKNEKPDTDRNEKRETTVKEPAHEANDRSFATV